jgi:uncharacterized lipoprotein YmbA
MLKTTLATALLATALLSGCTELSGGPVRYSVPVAQPTEKVRVGYRAIEVREVSLPEYAALSEMAMETPEGGITTTKTQLWADNPVRSVTLELSRNLGGITGATVASEPWPFESFPDARVEVRIEEMLTDRQNRFRLSGQYFVGPTEGEGRTRARVFDLTVPLADSTDPFAVAAARGRIIADLALLIAKDGLK